MIKKILLIWPPLDIEEQQYRSSGIKVDSCRFPLGIGYVAAYTEQELGIPCDLLDCQTDAVRPSAVPGFIRLGMSDEEIFEQLQALQPDLVGVSQMFSYLHDTVARLFRRIKQWNPDVVTVWGGTHPTVAPEKCVSEQGVDYLVLGEGEVPFVSLVRALNAGTPLEEVPALGYVRDGIVHLEKRRGWIEDLDRHPFPKRAPEQFRKYVEDFNQHRIVDAAQSMMVDTVVRGTNIVTSRGCPFACEFCTAPQFYLKRFKSRSPQNVFDEMKFLYDNYGINLFVIDDENVNFDVERIEGLADLIIANDLKITWFCEAGMLIYRLNEGLLEKFARSGLIELRFPVESGDPEILKQMRKPLKLGKVKPLVDRARALGIRVTGFLLIGMPNETEEQMWRTARFAEHVGFDWVHVGVIQPVPGSALHAQLTDEGHEIDYKILYNYYSANVAMYSIPNEDIDRIRNRMNDYLNFEGNYNLRSGLAQRAINEFGPRSRRYPTSSKINHFLGVAHYLNRDLPQAVEAFRNAVAGDAPDQYGSRRWLAALVDVASSDDPVLPSRLESELGFVYGAQGTQPERQSLAM